MRESPQKTMNNRRVAKKKVFPDDRSPSRAVTSLSTNSLMWTNITCGALSLYHCVLPLVYESFSQVEKEKALKNKGKATVETAGWRTQEVKARLTHSLIKGIDQWVVEVCHITPEKFFEWRDT